MRFALFLTRVFGFLNNLLQGLRPVINDYIIPAIQIVEAIKEAFSNKTGDKIKEYLKQILNDDDKVEAALQLLAQAIDNLSLVKTCLEKESTEDKLVCLFNAVQMLKPFQRRAVWRELAKIIAILNNGDLQKLSPEQLDTTVQIAYHQFVNSKKA